MSSYIHKFPNISESCECDNYVIVGYGEPDSILEDHLTDDHDYGDGDDVAGDSPANLIDSTKSTALFLTKGKAQAHTSSTEVTHEMMYIPLHWVPPSIVDEVGIVPVVERTHAYHPRVCFNLNAHGVYRGI